ncbi:outer membrane beta-barrel protein [Rickettsiella grylli]|uniref:Outer membrane protein beta-barrel domain-containing protein n=1 Tax=Rickettsiella grylli TaxID=59196 RepID=A8PML4_9COXI|nr:outer membrane beta-barrel protein [Rickettsiella grylli]EDP47042.1 hypothetical protein RICGR_0762 [Rickettsiella grylli]
MLKRNTTALLTGAITLFCTQNVRAEMAGFYAGLQLGYANTSINTMHLLTLNNGTSPVPLPELNQWAFAYRLSFGYQFDQYWAIEGGYRHVNPTDIFVSTPEYTVNASSQSSAFDLTVKSIVPITCKLSVNAKLGIAYLHPHAHGSVSVIAPYSGTGHTYSNTLEPTFGLGMSYTLKPNVPVEFSWNRIQKMGGDNHAPSSDFYSLGVAYYFG